ncbi:uncharacterized protein LOC141587721 [Silene latifolia]|uniref:uncharacterized protein LOC141587721 n=1 Tax=Silene latifolia TaxID=37657 RepID=UPI003D7860DC
MFGKLAENIAANWLRDVVQALVSKNKVGFITGECSIPEKTDKKFGQLNILELYDLKKTLSNLVQENLSLMEYYSKIRSIWEGIDNMDPMPSCTCGAIMSNCSCNLLKRLLDRETQAKLIQLLMGLNSGYEQVKSVAYSSKRRMPDNPVDSTPAKKPKDADFCIHCNKGGHDISDCHKLKTCTFCKIKVHIQERCYKYKAFLARQNKGKGKTLSTSPANNAYASFTEQNDEYVDVTPIDDFAALVPAVRHSSDQGPSDMVQNIIDTVMSKVLKVISDQSHTDITPLQSYVHFAGMTNTTKYFNSISNIFDWIVDTGATDHMTSNLALLSNVRVLAKPVYVSLPDGTVKVVHKSGTSKLNDKITLVNVLLVPDFNQNLLSVGKLITTTGLTAIFLQNECLFQVPTNKQVVAKAKRYSDLYKLTMTENKVSLDFSFANCNSLVKQSTEVHSSVKELANKDILLFHQRLGHSSVDKLQHVHLPIMNKIKNFFCESCVLAKHHIQVFPRSRSYATNCFNLVHMDVWGLYKVPTMSGFVKFVSTQFNSTIKVIRSDNGTEFFQDQCKDFFKNEGIVHQRSIVGRPQHNGRVERKHRHLLDIARALRLHSNLPLKFWGDCLLTATYLINKMPSSVLQWQTPYEVLFTEKPSYSDLRVFGCLYYGTMPPTVKDKFSKRARKSVFIVYPFNQKGYKLYDLEDHIVYTCRDVVFKETLFPYYRLDSSIDHHTPMLPVVTYMVEFTDWFLPADHESVPSTYSITSSNAANNDLSTDQAVNEIIPEADNTTTDPNTDLLIQADSNHNVVRKSDRPKRPSVLLNNFVLSKAKSKSLALHTQVINDLVNYDKEYLYSLCNVVETLEPSSYTQAKSYDKWVEAMSQKLQALEQNNTWELTTLPPDKNAISCK